MAQKQQVQGMNNGGRDKRYPKKLLVSYEEAIGMSSLDMEQFDSSLKVAAEYYFQHAKKLYLDNISLRKTVVELSREKNELTQQLKKFEALAAIKTQNESAAHNEEKKRRKRRNASEIERLYRCRAEGCQKSYGSEGTLSQHLKLKHPQLYSSLFGDAQEKLQAQAGDVDKSKEDQLADSEQSKPKSQHHQF